MSEDRWRKLEVWKSADDLVYKIYCETRAFPKDEMFGLVSQLKRASLSIPTNIVEGYPRKSEKELAHFVNISLGSFSEIKHLLYFSERLGYIKKEKYEGIMENVNLLGKKLWRFYEKVRNDLK